MVHATAAALATALAFVPLSNAGPENGTTQDTSQHTTEQITTNTRQQSTADSAPISLEALEKLPPTASGFVAKQGHDAHMLPAPILTPRSISGFTDPEISGSLKFPETF